MKDIFINRYDHYEILLFIAGLVSTFQGVLFHGVTLFSWFLLALVIIGVIKKRGNGNFNFKDTKTVLIGLVLVSMTITEIITVYLDEYPEWTGRSVKNYILMLAVFVLFFVLRGNSRYGEIFFKGVMVSSIIQYVFCCIEYIAYKTKGLDLTEKYLSVATVLKDGRPTITGLTTNPGMLVPVILISMCLSKSLIVKVMALGTALIINSSTAVICVALYFLILAALIISDRVRNGLNLGKYAVGIIAMAILIIISFPSLREKIIALYGYLLERLGTASEGVGEGINGMSERLHFRYYWSMPYIFDQIGLTRILFGFGKNCSGIPFSELYAQYQGELWIPETDPIATLYDVGVVGTVAMYGMLIKMFFDFYRRSVRKCIFMACVLLGGAFYGFQMTWFLLLELFLWDGMLCIRDDSVMKNKNVGVNTCG